MTTLKEAAGVCCMNTQRPKVNFAEIHKQAHAAGMAAGLSFDPNPMIVTTQFGGDRGKSYFVPDGVCGFAWVEFPGNTAWGRWAKKSGVARPAYKRGLSIWVSEFNQSMQKKEAYARAYADVLRKHFIECHVESRMD